MDNNSTKKETIFEWNHVSGQDDHIRPIKNETKKLPPSIDIDSLYQEYKKEFQLVNNIRYDARINNGEVHKLTYTLFYYLFKQEESFLKSPLLNHKINEPSISKGLCLIGGYGTGKTYAMKTICSLTKKINHIDPDHRTYILNTNGNKTKVKGLIPTIDYNTAKSIVIQYESCSTPHEKHVFWKKMTKDFMYFDDVLAEREASNYGKLELFADIFEKREEMNLKTIISLNFMEGQSLESTLKTIYNRYGGRVEDRFYSMFNFIEMKGMSLRK